MVTSDITNSVSIWDTVPGLLLMCVRLVIFAFFLWALNTTLRKFNQKKGFFCKMAFFFSFWFVTTPLLAFFSVSGALRPHLRFSVMQIYNMSNLWVALMFLNIMYW